MRGEPLTAILVRPFPIYFGLLLRANSLGFSMTGCMSGWLVLKELSCGAEADYPSPIRQLGFQSTYTIQSQSIPRHFCSPLPMYLSQTPTRG